MSQETAKLCVQRGGSEEELVFEEFEVVVEMGVIGNGLRHQTKDLMDLRNLPGLQFEFD